MRKARLRARILDATLTVVGRDGFANATVDEVLNEAEASRSTFYRHFGDLREAYLASLDHAERKVARALSGIDAREPWLQRVRAGVDAVGELLGASPELARAMLVEPPAAGPDAMRWRDGALRRLYSPMEAGREVRLRSGGAMPERTAQLAVGAGLAVLVRAARSGDLAAGGWAEELLFALLMPYVGPQAAAGMVEEGAAGPRVNGNPATELFMGDSLG